MGERRAAAVVARDEPRRLERGDDGACVRRQRGELVVGRGAARQFANLVPGQEVKLGTQVWKVAGVFASGDALESEV
ncbi:MAG TPA: hypothetical protein VGM56_09910, partial [Byssovorax sp.]